MNRFAIPLMAPFSAALVACAPPAATAQSAAPATCAHDRAAMLALDLNAFDQDPGGGWRPLADRPGCEGVAADLVRDYRLQHKLEDSMLYWHEGQLRASMGDFAAARPLFEASRKPADPAWNAYADATIAFLARDRPGLDAARARLVAVPRPPYFDELQASTEREFGFRISWPMNLNIVDGFVKCFDKPYKEAYSAPCAEQIGPTPPAGRP